MRLVSTCKLGFQVVYLDRDTPALFWMTLHTLAAKQQTVLGLNTRRVVLGRQLQLSCRVQKETQYADSGWCSDTTYEE